MTVSITDLTFDAIIGILDHERLKAQRIVVNATFSYTYEGEFINYADVAEHIKSQMRQSGFELIEEALQSLQQSLKAAFPLMQELTLHISKPDILPDCIVSVGDTCKF